jgi:hypothetical protein
MACAAGEYPRDFLSGAGAVGFVWPFKCRLRGIFVKSRSGTRFSNFLHEENGFEVEEFALSVEKIHRQIITRQELYSMQYRDMCKIISEKGFDA